MGQETLTADGAQKLSAMTTDRWSSTLVENLQDVERDELRLPSAGLKPTLRPDKPIFPTFINWFMIWTTDFIIFIDVNYINPF